MVLKKTSGAPPKTYRDPSNLLPNSTALTHKHLPLNQPHCASGHCTFEGGVMSWFVPRLPMSFQSLASTPDSLTHLQTLSASDPPGSLAYVLFSFTDPCMFPILFLYLILSIPLFTFRSPSLDPDVSYVSPVSDSIPV